MNPTPPPSPTPADAPPVKNLELKAALLLVLMVVLLLGSAAYILYARGVLEPTQRLVLISDDSEGVVVGMDMTFAGFAIGRVARIELADDGNVRILIDVPESDAKWLRTSSIFTMERGLVGGTRIRAYSGVLDDPPLPDGAERTVLRGDTAAEIPKLAASMREVLENLAALTRSDGALAGTLSNVAGATERLKGPQGAMGVLMGSDEDAKKLVLTIERTNALLLRADALARRLDSLAANADRQVFGQGAAPGEGSLAGDARATVQQLTALLTQARTSLQKVDAVLVEVQGIAGNTREATGDLGTLRGEVESSLRKVESLINDINRKWPFARDTEIKLP
ncbi:MAG: mammalian cell entry protein [Hydrogenophaga sp.]|jgi:phospholipid/cholesterol/gamma-HCH transport system substrate-binding protein|uniref:MlaD family protein n=1 Tax=Hydrogenophaga sp. TaxID=1904254 RepID=UPI00260E09EB|nr:mammalian cell entry protein [Hydrogenophaga sp.]MCV0438004.1 mammalian cell entry protein [Hydrogenophaga sp.]